MKHFDITEWSDFVRGLVEPAQRAVLESHLSSGCPRCQYTVDRLREVRKAAQAEAQYQVPPHVLHRAKAIYALWQPAKAGLLDLIRARLIFDSFRDPLPVGVRSGQRMSRQVHYQAGNFSLDMRMEHERNSSEVTLVGQIANQQNPNKQMASVPIYIISGKQIVAWALTNRFGEFQLLCESKGQLRMYVQLIEEQKHILVSLRRLLTDGSGKR